VAVGTTGRDGSRPASIRDATCFACVSTSYVPGAPSNAVMLLFGATSFDACFGPVFFAAALGSGAPPSSGQKPGGMGRCSSESIGAIGVTPATGSTWNDAQL